MSKQKSLAVAVNHDQQEGVWYVMSADIPGLHAEAETLDALVSVIVDLAPELTSHNLPGTAADTPICFQLIVITRPSLAVQLGQISSPNWPTS